MTALVRVNRSLGSGLSPCRNTSIAEPAPDRSIRPSAFIVGTWNSLASVGQGSSRYSRRNAMRAKA